MKEGSLDSIGIDLYFYFFSKSNSYWKRCIELAMLIYDQTLLCLLSASFALIMKQ